MGFSGIVTKPIDTSELFYRVCRAMNVDTSSRYFYIENGIQICKIPNSPTSAMAAELSNYISIKTREVVDSGLNRLLIDANAVERIDMTIIKLIIQIIQACAELSIKFRVVGSPNFSEQSKAFAETKDFEIFPDKETALMGF